MKNSYLSTGQTSRDFVEIPSQFHEGFLSDKQFVSENFKHFETGERMPDLLVDNITKMNSRGEMYSWVRTSLASLFDQEIHGKNLSLFTKDKKKIDKLFNSLWAKFLKIALINKNMQFPSKWGHLVHGYDAKYYSYVISKVYAVDFWNEFSKGGIKKGIMSEKYKKFLEGANTKEEKVLVQEYLGREVNKKPFLDSLR
jgi:Zn-dependent oligopeptidase